MANAYVGNPYALVFPVDCDGFLKIPYSTHSDINEPDLWAHGAGFTVEAVITPYDVNGNSQTGKGKTLEITGPSGAYANGITDRYAQKMMLFSNTSFQFYLENQTTGNVNQPAEYRLAAKVGSTTLNSPVVIKPVSTLHGYYDQDGFYNGMRTSLTKIDSNASLSQKQGSVQITSDLSTYANTKATGTLTLGSIPSDELYAAGTERTVDITIEDQPTTNDSTLDTADAYALGTITFGAAPYEMDLSDSNNTNHTDHDYAIKITSDTTDFYFFAITDSSGTYRNGDSLNGVNISDGEGTNLTYGSDDYAYVYSSDTTTAATNLQAAINTISNSVMEISAIRSTNQLTLTAEQIGTDYNDNIVVGSNLSSSITSTGLSGGATGSNINEYLTITIKTGPSTTVVRNFKYVTTGNNATTTTTADNTTVYRVRVGNNENGTASNLVSAINTAFNTSTEASANIIATAQLRVTQKYVGNNFGTGSSVTETTNYASDTLHTIGSFTAGAQGSDTTYNKYIKIGTNFFSPCDDPSLVGATKTITGDSGSVTSRLFLGDSSLANNLTSLAGQINTDISPSIISSLNTTTGVINFELNDFTASMTLIENITNVSVTGISGGQEPAAYISITDAAGVERRYKPSTIETTGTTDSTYVFFEASSDTSATATELELAIESTNGHGGSLVVSRSTNTLTLVVTTTDDNQTMSLDSTNITSSDVTLTAFAGAPKAITVSQDQTGILGVGNKIYDSSGAFVDTVESISGTQITLTTAQSSITSTIYKEQPKEAFYVNSLYKVSCILEKSGRLKLYMNNALVAETTISSFTFDMTNEDCFIGQDGTNINTQFMGELYEIAMKKGSGTSPSIHTLDPGYSDIIFYYRFGDE